MRRRKPLTLTHMRWLRRKKSSLLQQHALLKDKKKKYIHKTVNLNQNTVSNDRQNNQVIMEEESMGAMCDDSCICSVHICTLTSRISHMELLLDQALEQLKIEEKKKLLARAEKEKELPAGRILAPVEVPLFFKRSEVTSLHDAAKRRNTPAVARFLARGADPNALDTDGNTALHCAACSGDILATELLLACGAALEAKNNNASTPLLMAAKFGHLEVAIFLIQKGAQIDEPDQAGQTPLMCAVIRHHEKMVSFLESRGASLDVKDAYGDTPIIIAAKYASTKCLKILMSSPRTSVKEMMKALEVAGDRQTFRTLKNAVPVSKICATNFSLLPRLAAHGWERLVQLILNDCRNCENRNHMKNLQLAVRVAFSEQLLVRLWSSRPFKLRGIAMHQAAVKGWVTALDVILKHWRAHGGSMYHLDEVKEAMRATSDLKVMLHLARAEGQIRNSVAACEAFCISAERGWKTMLSSLIIMGVPVNVAQSDGCTALHYAAERGHDSCVKLLLRKGASPNVRNDAGWTPLQLAADVGHKAVVKSLLKTGAYPIMNIRSAVHCVTLK